MFLHYRLRTATDVVFVLFDVFQDNAVVEDSKKETKNGEEEDEEESSDEEEHAGSFSSIAELRLAVFLDINLLFELPIPYYCRICPL